MNRPERRRGFTRIDLSVALAIGLACLSILIPACSKAVDTEKQKEDENNVKKLGQGTHKMFDQMTFGVRVSAGRAQTNNNLKQMGIAVNGLASRTEGLLPPAVGTWPGTKGANSSIFFHILPDIEHFNLYNMYQKDPSKIPDTTVVRTYLSPCDPSNDGKSALCSYAANAAVFGTLNGGSCRYPATFNAKGTSNTILFFEHYARPVVKDDGTTVSNYWYSPSTSLYAMDFKPDGWKAIKDAQFDVPFDGADGVRPDNATAHGFITNSMLVGLADGSTRNVTKDVLKTHTFQTVAPPIKASIWQWACAVSGPLGDAPMPPGW